MTYVEQLYSEMADLSAMWESYARSSGSCVRLMGKYHELLIRYGANRFTKVPYLFAEDFLEELRELCK